MTDVSMYALGFIAASSRPSWPHRVRRGSPCGVRAVVAIAATSRRVSSVAGLPSASLTHQDEVTGIRHQHQPVALPVAAGLTAGRGEPCIVFWGLHLDHASLRRLPIARRALLHLPRGVEAEVGMAPRLGRPAPERGTPSARASRRHVPLSHRIAIGGRKAAVVRHHGVKAATGAPAGPRAGRSRPPRPHLPLGCDELRFQLSTTAARNLSSGCSSAAQSFLPKVSSIA